MNLKYIFLTLLTIPLFPLLYFQGKKIRKKVPTLPEARGTNGIKTVNSKKKLQMLTLGESTIAGVGVDTHENGFTGSLATELSNKLDSSVVWKVYARSGYTAKKVAKKIIPKITENNIDLIVIGLGGNDAFTLSTPRKWKNDIQYLLEELTSRFPDSTIVFTNMPPIKEFPAFTSLIKFTIGNLVEILGEELEKVVSQYQNVYYYSQKITLENWVEKMNIKAQPLSFFSDGVHPSKLTYQTWAKDFSNFMIQEKEIKNNLELRAI